MEAEYFTETSVDLYQNTRRSFSAYESIFRKAIQFILQRREGQVSNV
jgi:hypothetical protein